MRALPLLALLALAACDAGPAKPGAQVAARVNGAEISLHQVRAAESATPVVEADRLEASRALERVIDQELLVQAALALDLDRQPAVADAIEKARRQILAQAFIDKAAAAGAKNGEEEIRAFYEQHPMLFERRRVYRFQELAVAAPKDEVEAIRHEAARARNLDGLTVWLKSRNLAFNISTSTRPAEQLPLGYLPQLAAMKDGEVAVFAAPSGVSVLQLLQSHDAPLSEKQAAPIIDRFLQGRKRLQIAEEAVRRLREKATIEYAGMFQGMPREKGPDAPHKQRSLARTTATPTTQSHSVSLP
jgi:EpsD family peptidyl-prolyl cis-trans isomerase